MIFDILIVSNDAKLKKILFYLFNNKYGIKMTFASDSIKALKLLDEGSNYHLIIVDYCVKDSDGLALISAIRGIPNYSFSYIIFISDSFNHLIPALNDYHCYKFFLKPIDTEELYQATSKILTYLSNYSDSNNNRKSVIFNFRNISVKIFINEIFFVETSKQKCLIHTRCRVYDIFLPFNKIINMLLDFNIIQVHRSFAVNIENINCINKSIQPWEIIFSSYDKTVPVSRKYKNKLIKLFNA